MEIIKAYLTKNPCYKEATPATPVGILVHATGANNRNLQRYVDSPERLGKNIFGNTWNRSTATTCVHAFIGYDKDKQVIVAETLPHNYACWGCGKGSKGSYNYNPQAHIQFEICQGSNTDAVYYHQAISCAEEYCAHLCRMYGWDAGKITSHVEAHKVGYASNHGDPTSWMKHFGDSMDKIRARVQALLDSTAGNAENLPSEPPVEKTEEIPAQKENAQPALTYVVRGGDTLWAIAKKQLGDGNRYKEIMELNGLKSTTIRKGDVLKLPGDYVTYTVKGGDSLWTIAKKQLGDGSRYTEIVKLNGLKSTTIHKGDALKLPKK